MTHARLLALALLTLGSATAASADPISGSWTGLLNGFAPLEATLTLKGTRVTGVTHFAQKDFPVTGTFDAQKKLVTYTFKWVDGKTATVRLRLAGNTLGGTYRVHTASPDNTVTLTRVTTATGAAAGPGGTAGAYVMTGEVRDEKGNPIAGVEVFADHTAYYNMNAVGRTDARGRYRLPLAQQPGTWNAGASLRGAVGGQPFEVRLSPDDDTPFDGSKGAVRDFTYRAGVAASGKVYTSVAHSAVELDYATLQFTFTPDGPNVAGSTAPFTRKYVDGSGVPDIPLGRYRVSATQVLNGEQQHLLLSSRQQKNEATTVRAEFTHDSRDGQTLELFLNNP